MWKILWDMKLSEYEYNEFFPDLDHPTNKTSQIAETSEYAYTEDDVTLKTVKCFLASKGDRKVFQY